MRGKPAKKRKVLPDAVYNSTVISKFINYIMLDGKKEVATQIVYKAIERAAEISKLKPLEVFNQALENVKPKIEVRSRRVGGANYQVPVPVSPERQESLAMKWIVLAAREGRKSMESYESLANELLNALKKDGGAFKKKEDTHRMADANKAFAHFSW